MTRRLRHTFALLALATVLFPLSAAAGAPDTTETASDPEQRLLERARLMHLLNSESVAKQQRAVRRIGTYAHTGRYAPDFFALMVTPLHALAARSPAEGLRIMAVSALSSIGTDAAHQSLQALASQAGSDRVETLARAAVVASEAPRMAVRTQ